MGNDRTFRDINGIDWQVMPMSIADDGWLSFQAGHLERRLAPFPANWQTATVQRLEQMCRVAKPVQRDETAVAWAGLSTEPVAETVDTTPAEGSEIVVDVPALNDHMSVLADAYPARHNRITFRG